MVQSRLSTLKEAASVRSSIETEANQLQSWLHATEDDVSKLTRHIGHQTDEAQNALQIATVSNLYIVCLISKLYDILI